MNTPDLRGPRIWILGASDPEMEAIERLLRECGEHVEYALTEDGQRVRPHNAYQAACPESITGGMGEIFRAVYRVECAWGDYSYESLQCCVTPIDHHRPGDPGFGRPPREFLTASSLGQVCAVLHEEIPHDLVLVAAADHCLGSAYRGECPGIDPDELMRWRVKQRAAFQRRPEATVEADIANARAALHAAPLIELNPVGNMPHTHDHDWARSVCDGCAQAPITVRDMRAESLIRELVEAATRDDIAYISGPLIGPDGKRKYTCSGRPEHVQAFLEIWAPAEGLVGLYGDPERGFAGGYCP